MNSINYWPLIHKLMSYFTLQDNSDNQYASFRDNIPTLVPLSLTYLALSYLYQRYCCSSTPIKHPNQTLSRTYFILGAAFLYIAVTNGTSIFKVLFIATVSYTIGMLTKGSWLNPALTWGWNLAVLFANEWNDGYRYGQLGEPFAFLVSITIDFPMIDLIFIHLYY
jgi:hypothetical protein